jgi:hypothetical protein
VIVRGDDAIDLDRFYFVFMALRGRGMPVQTEGHALLRVMAMIQGVTELGREESEPKDETQDRGSEP